MSECVVRMPFPDDNCPIGYDILGIGYCPVEGHRRCDFMKTKERPNWCPIIRALPENHGRLVDVDADLTHDTVIAGIHHCANNKGCGGGELCGYCDYGRFDPDVIKVLDKVLKDAEVAMKKQIPIKPMMACGHTTEPWMDYCPRCGQRLDWTKEGNR